MFGLKLRAIKNDEIAAEVAGINVHRSKLIAFTIAGMFAGVAGALYAHLITYIDPNVFNTDCPPPFWPWWCWAEWETCTAR